MAPVPGNLYVDITPYPLTNLLIIDSNSNIYVADDRLTFYRAGVPEETTITISADGYVSQTITIIDDITNVVLQQQSPQCVSNLSDGTNTYIIKDAIARASISNLATVATTGSYNDLSNKPTIPTVNNPTITFTQGGTTKGTITLNQASNQTINFDAGGGGGSSYTAGNGIDITSNVISVDGVQTNELSIDTTPTQNSSNLITSGGVYDVLGDIETLINAL